MRDIVEQIDSALDDRSVSCDAMRCAPDGVDDDDQYAPAPGSFLRYSPSQSSLGEVEVDLRGYSASVLDRIQPGSFVQVNGVQWTVAAVDRRDPHTVKFDLTPCE